MTDVKLYRKRYIPFETVFLKDDIILSRDEERIVTKWNVLRPKTAFDHGISCYFLEKGFKISKFLKENEELVYYYCDIIRTEYIPEENTYIFHDLLVDVVVYPDGAVQVLDAEELADALDDGIIDEAFVKAALRQLAALLHEIYNNRFDEYTSYLEIGAENDG